jgi:ribosome biogenesis GTPase
MNLPAIGYTPALDHQFEPFRADGLIPARVVVSYGSSCIVWTASGEYNATVAGRLKPAGKDPAAGHPVVGDWVAMRPPHEASAAVVHAVLPRRTAFIRKVAGLKTKAQVVAANIDRIFIVTSANREFNPRRLERYLTLARESGAQPIIVLSKIDLAANELPAFLAQARQLAGNLPVHPVCAVTGKGMRDLDTWLQPGITIALLGSSGVGKSTLINMWLGEERLATQQIRADERGRHTTSRREMLLLANGALVIDTPGMREVQLWEGSEGLVEAFDDIEELAQKCRFRDCRHTAEPGCAVRQAADNGTLDPQRLEAYLRLNAEIAAANKRKTEQSRTTSHGQKPPNRR